MKKDRANKQRFLQGAAILTIGTLMVKVIGLLYKMPLNRIIGTEGFGHFSVAYSIYNVLLTISSTGLPVAVARMVAEASTLGNKRQIQKIYITSLKIFLIIGVVCSGAMLLFARQLAELMRDPLAVYAIIALAPAVLFVSIICSFRGYFQGQQYMTPTAVSQVIEALSKLVIGLGAVIVIVRLGQGVEKAAGGAILGVTMGTVLASIYLAYEYRKRHVRLTPEDEKAPVSSTKETAAQLLRLAIPITIGSAGLQIFNAIDTRIIQGRLIDSLHMGARTATSLFGTYSAAQTFYMLPAALIQPLAIGIIPSVTEALTLNKFNEARRTEESAVRMTALIGLPCGAGLAILAAPIQKIIYHYDPGTLEIAGPLLTLLGMAVIFNSMVTVTNAILQAHGFVNLPIVTTLIGGVVNIVTDYILIGMRQFNIYGAAIATIAYCGVIMLLNIAAMHYSMEQPPHILRQFAKPMIATAVMAVGTYLCYETMAVRTGSTIISTGSALIVAVIIYAGLVYGMKIVTWYDCQLLPKGELIAKLLRVSKPEETE